MPLDETELNFLEFADSVDDVVSTLDDQWRFVFVSRQALVISHQSIDALLGRKLWDVFPALVGTPTAAAYQKAMIERVTVHIEHPGIVSDRWYDIHVYPYRSGIAIYGRDITERKLAEQALRDSEERLRTQYESIPIPTYTWQRSGTSFKLISHNAAASRISDGTTQHVVGRQLHEIFADVPVLLEAVWTCWEQRAVVRREIHYDYRFTAKSRDLAMTVAFVPPDMVIVHTEDITSQKDAERKLKALNETLEQRVAERTAELEARTRQLELSADRNRLLVQEVDHRVGNNLTGLIGLVAFMRNQTRDVDRFASAIDARLRAMAHAHKILAASDWPGLDLRKLAESTLKAVQDLAPHQVPEQLEGPEISLSSKQTYALALILTEWFTNSCKYGAHSVPEGRLRIAWSIAEMVDARIVRLSWIERGGPSPPAEIRPSLGTLLANRFSSRELSGKCEMRFPTEGAEHAIEFPIAQAHAET